MFAEAVHRTNPVTSRINPHMELKRPAMHGPYIELRMLTLGVYIKTSFIIPK